MSKYVALGIIVAIFIVIGPLLTIWSINTLFNTGIDYNFNTWSASFLLTSLITGNSYSKK